MIQGTIISNGNNDTECGYDYPNIEEQILEESAPIQESAPAEGETLDDLTAQFSAMFNAFSEQLPNGSHEQKSSKNLFKKFASYIGSKQFKDDVNEKAEKYKVPPKQIAKNFFLKVLGIIGDILGIVVNTVTSIIDTAVSLLATLLHGAVTVVNKVGNAVASVVTLNQTNLKTA